jgi:signal transduction histidine kinase
MTLAIDHTVSRFQLSATSQKMLELRHEVFAQWAHSVRDGIEEANVLEQPVLINTLHSFYDSMAELITPKHPKINESFTSTLASEHGGERARLTSYGPKEIILEYQLLRAALLDIMKRNAVTLTEEEVQVIDACIEGAMREAVTAYAVAVAAMREQVMTALVHDLRHPLAAASANAELIVRTADSTEAKASAAVILKNTARMDEMIHELLDVMAFQSGAMLRLYIFNFDILELVKYVCAQAEVASGRRFEITGESVEVIWCHEKIHRALENLIGNAVKYGAPHTPISIKLDRLDQRLSISVHNEGNPIPADEIENVFQVFTRGRTSQQSYKEGWGIGLTFVRAVAASHGGSCVVDSSLERGTSFVIEMPVDARTVKYPASA